MVSNIPSHYNKSSDFRILRTKHTPFGASTCHASTQSPSLFDTALLLIANSSFEGSTMATTAASLPNTALFPNSSSLGGKAPPFLGGHRKSLDFESNPVRRRRRRRLRGEAGPLVMASAAGSGGGGAERFYLNFTGFPFPLGPFLNRRTIRTEVRSAF